MMTGAERHTLATRLENRKGFTLLEIIVTLILISITGVVMFPVLRTNLTKSAVPMTRLDSQYQLVLEMERLTARYRDEILNDTLNINTFKSTYVDTSAFVDAGNTVFVGLNQITGSNGYTSQSSTILRVTLVDDDQWLVSFFTE